MNSFLFVNKWINKENKLRVRTIFKNIYWLQTRKLVRQLYKNKVYIIRKLLLFT